MGISIVREPLAQPSSKRMGSRGRRPRKLWGFYYILEQVDGLIFLYMYTSRSGTGWTLSSPLLSPPSPFFFFYAKKWGGTCPPGPPLPPPLHCSIRVRLCLTFEAKISVFKRVVRGKTPLLRPCLFSNKRRFKTRISNKQRFKTPIQNGVRSCLTFEAKISVFKRG